MNAIPSGAANRRVPRFSEQTEKPAERTSGSIRAEIEVLDKDREAAVAQLAELEAAYSSVLLSNDDAAAEKHEAETARIKRVVARSDLRRPALEAELGEAEAREAEQRRAEQKADADAAVKAVLALAESEYCEPAKRIAAFVRQWAEANTLAVAAGVPTADDIARVVRPERRIPARYGTSTVTHFLDEEGNPTAAEHPIKDDGTYDRTSKRQQVQRQEPVLLEPERFEPEQRLPALAAAVSLPGVEANELAYWPPDMPRR